MKKVRKNITVPEDNLRQFSEKAEKMGMDANALMNLLIAGVIGRKEYEESMKVINQVSGVSGK